MPSRGLCLDQRYGLARARIDSTGGGEEAQAAVQAQECQAASFRVGRIKLRHPRCPQPHVAGNCRDDQDRVGCAPSVTGMRRDGLGLPRIVPHRVELQRGLRSHRTMSQRERASLQVAPAHQGRLVVVALVLQTLDGRPSADIPVQPQPGEIAERTGGLLTRHKGENADSGEATAVLAAVAMPAHSPKPTTQFLVL